MPAPTNAAEIAWLGKAVGYLGYHQANDLNDFLYRVLTKIFKLLVQIALGDMRNVSKSANLTGSSGTNVEFLGDINAGSATGDATSFVALNGTKWSLFKSSDQVDVFCVKNLSK